MKKIGILGSGVVAQALGNGFLKHNYKVMLSSRNLSKLQEWKDNGGENAYIGSFYDAGKFGDIVILALKGSIAVEAVEDAGPQNLMRKTVIDTTNPVSPDLPPENGVLRYFTNHDESLMERLQTQFPEVHFVKAFNSVGNSFMVEPPFAEKPTMFICGNNDASKREVKEILEKFGWEVADMGKATSARAIEPLAMLWCIPGMLDNEWKHAFKLLRA
jgi:8-hydroxy-5-deazaflavin:NADPH oxidoreductase